MERSASDLGDMDAGRGATGIHGCAKSIGSILYEWGV